MFSLGMKLIFYVTSSNHDAGVQAFARITFNAILTSRQIIVTLVSELNFRSHLQHIVHTSLCACRVRSVVAWNLGSRPKNCFWIYLSFKINPKIPETSVQQKNVEFLTIKVGPATSWKEAQRTIPPLNLVQDASSESSTAEAILFQYVVRNCLPQDEGRVWCRDEFW